MSMRRVILALTVAALMAVILVLTAGPAFAAGQSGGINGGGEFRAGGGVNTNTIGGGDGPKKGGHKGGDEGPSASGAQGGINSGGEFRN
jgi:uncharacterized membrane protein